MKHIYKILVLFAVIASFNSCDNSEGLNEGKFDASTDTGWVEFFTSSDLIEAQIDELDLSDAISAIPVAVNVPVNKTDLTINYSFVPVSGANPNTIFSNSGKLIAEAGKSSNFGLYYPEIEINLAEASGITEIMIFDVVLESTDRGSISAGIPNSSTQTTIRYQICPSLSSSTNQFLGDYNITVTTGPSPFGLPVIPDSVVTLTEGPDGEFSRQFDIFYLGLEGGRPSTTIPFTFDNGEIIIGNLLFSAVSCDGLTGIRLGADSSAVLDTPCGDSTITLNMVQFQNGSGGCGLSDVPFTAVLTKI